MIYTKPNRFHRRNICYRLTVIIVSYIIVAMTIVSNSFAKDSFPAMITWIEYNAKPVAVENLPNIKIVRMGQLETTNVICVFKFSLKDTSGNEKEYVVNDISMSLHTEKDIIVNKGERNRILNTVMQLMHISGTGTISAALYLPAASGSNRLGKQVSNLLTINVFTTYPPF